MQVVKFCVSSLDRNGNERMQLLYGVDEKGSLALCPYYPDKCTWGRKCRYDHLDDKDEHRKRVEALGDVEATRLKEAARLRVGMTSEERARSLRNREAAKAKLKAMARSRSRSSSKSSSSSTSSSRSSSSSTSSSSSRSSSGVQVNAVGFGGCMSRSKS